MKFAALAWLLGILGALPGCSGQYHVGTDAAIAGATNSNASSGGGSNGTHATGEGGTNTSSAGSPPTMSSGGEGVLPGASDAPDPASLYCGMPLSPSLDIEFAPPDVVYARLSRFLFDVATPVPNLPSRTTRQWAGQFATSVLDMLSVPSAPGMTRFMKSWWPGTPTPEFWAAYFTSRQGTLTDLFTSTDRVPNGAGVLTDPTMLGRGYISARGSLIQGQALCTPIPAEPGVDPPSPLRQGVTRRAQLDQTVDSTTCHACHSLIDPFGYPLGAFALDGNYQTVENDLPIDTRATLPFKQTMSTVTVQDAQTLGLALSGSCEVAICFTRQMFADAALNAQLPNPASDQEIVAVASQFAASGLRLSELLRLIVESNAFLSAN